MTKTREGSSRVEKRQYTRMGTVFPVEFEVLNPAGEKAPSSKFQQAFTRDVSAGGMCLEYKALDPETERLLRLPNASLDLTINTTFAKNPIKAVSRVVWIKKEERPLPVRYLIGVAYSQIDDKARRRIIKHANRLIWIPRFTVLGGIIVLALLANLFFNNQELLTENKKLVTQLVESAEKKSSVAADLYELQKRKSLLDQELSKAQQNIKNLETSLASLTAENTSQKNSYEKDLQTVLATQKDIGAELQTIQAGRERLQATYQDLSKTEELTATTALKQMYGWLKSHQNLRTGLVASFEGDPSLEDWGFTYDQSLVCQTFLLFGDVKNAEAILSFYDKRADQENGAFFNTYNTVDGRPVEHVIHAGPNIWLGIAALQYEHRMKDGRFLPLAKRIGEWTIRMQDPEGGIKGGPAFTWYSTEHNLDAYAFFRMLYQVTKDEKYKKASDKVLNWIIKYAYSVKERRINRGKGDATIATDTFSWSIAALGPATLKGIEFDPEAIMDFAEKHCEVTVSYKQPSGKIAKARGFDFAKAENIGRGGVISTEWTAQVIVTYQILADYFESKGDKDKAALYREKTNFYLNELQKLIITSPSRTGQGRGCLPYASVDSVDTGHGWRTPKGKRTGSVSGTAYGVFAWAGYNPFSLDNKKAIH